MKAAAALAESTHNPQQSSNACNTVHVGATVLLLTGLFASTQLVGIYGGWSTAAPSSSARASVILHTTSASYVPYAAGTPMGRLDDQGFLRLLTCMTCATVCTTGIGMEIVIGEPLIHALSTARAQEMWKTAQLAFSLFVTVAIGARSFATLPFAVIGLWKMGFPETLACFRKAFDSACSPLARASAYANGVALVLHHFSSAYIISSCTVGLIPLDRRIIALTIPLIIQHLVVLLKYTNLCAYAAVELCLEIWWEWEAFANVAALSVEAGYDVTTRGTCFSMLLSHWLYWLAALASVPKLFAVTSTHRMSVDEWRRRTLVPRRTRLSSTAGGASVRV